jgi:hypothetical protein
VRTRAGKRAAWVMTMNIISYTPNCCCSLRQMSSSCFVKVARTDLGRTIGAECRFHTSRIWWNTSSCSSSCCE